MSKEDETIEQQIYKAKETALEKASNCHIIKHSTNLNLELSVYNAASTLFTLLEKIKSEPNSIKFKNSGAYNKFITPLEFMKENDPNLYHLYLLTMVK